jgi:glycerol uptake facilitator-like aquaporin
MRQKGLTGELLAEIFGTFILILGGDGVVANVGLAPFRISGRLRGRWCLRRSH